MQTELSLLIQKYKKRQLSLQEAHTFKALLADDAYRQELGTLIDANWDGKDASNPELMEIIYQQLLLNKEEKKETPVRRINPLRWAVAASIILALSLGSYFIFFNKKNEPIAVIPTKDALVKDVAPPQTNRAMITLADGKQVYLDEAANGQLAQLGNIKLVKLENGKIAYQTANGEVIKELQYNTLANPRGSKVIDMMLSDSSHVWLNAGSSVKYPVAFIGDERRVEITGEAYFEVAHDATKPFYVSKGDAQVKVLGTHFNVNAYDDESDIKVTLLEGSVQTGNNNGMVIIKPGQQAQLTPNIKPQTTNPDLDEVMAWKNGLFSFKNASIYSIMRQLEKWYDLDIKYNGEIKEKFHVEMSRNTSVSNVFKILQEMGFVKFRIEGKMITVTP